MAVRTVAMLLLLGSASCRSSDDEPSTARATAAPSTATASSTAAIAELRTHLGATAPCP